MTTAVRGFAICTAPRSGSNFLGQLLASTGVLGNPLEYFNGSARRALEAPGYPDDPVLQMQRILTDGATRNGVYGLKIFAHQFDAVAGARWTDRMPDLHFVHLEREDLLGQAISWARAKQTGQYRSTQIPRGVPIFDAQLVRRLLLTIVEEQARWRAYFAARGGAHLRLVYEDLVADPESAVRAVAELLRVSFDGVDPTLIGLQQQRDEINDAWRRSFIAEESDPNVLWKLGA